MDIIQQYFINILQSINPEAKIGSYGTTPIPKDNYRFTFVRTSKNSIIKREDLPVKKRLICKIDYTK